MNEALKNLLNELNKLEEAGGYDYLNLESELTPYEKRRIAEIEEAARYCKECTGLKECRNSSDEVGYEWEVVNKPKQNGERRQLIFQMRGCRHRQRAEQERKLEHLWKESNLPECYKGQRENNLSEGERRLVKMLLNGEVKEVYVIGGIHEREALLATIGNEFIWKEVSVRYENATELLSELRVTNPSYHAKMEMLKNVEVLIIEGLRAELSHYNDEQLGIILNHRNRRGRKSIVNGAVRTIGIRGVTGEQLRKYKEAR